MKNYILTAFFISILASFISTLMAMPVEVDSLASCYDSSVTKLNIDSSKRVAIYVHGFHAGIDGFSKLAREGEKNEITPVCFRYNDRDSLLKSALKLASSVKELAVLTGIKNITLVAHSLGGLVTRKSVTGSENILKNLELDIELVTVSTPFGGIKSSKACNSKFMKIVTLGISKYICKKISGDKWDQISPKADFIINPGTLIRNVTNHQNVITAEKGFCLKRSKWGYCKVKDYAFSIDEQRNELVDCESTAVETVIEAGHTGIIVDDYQYITEIILSL